jgi:hypothetical protein
MWEPKKNKVGTSSQIKQRPIMPETGGWPGKGFKKNDMGTRKPGFEK